MSALAVTHLRGVDKDSCPIKVETIPIGCQLDGSGSQVRLVQIVSEQQLKVSKKHVQVPLMWPTTISHRIDVSSPLYGFSDEQLTDGRVEVIG